MKPALAEPPKGRMVSSDQAVETPQPDLGRTEYYCGLAVLLLAACALDFALSIYWMKFSRAEVFFADCARAMIQTQNYVTPLYRGQPFFDKPILVYWLIISMFKSFGLSHLAARVPSIVASLVAVAATAQGAAALFNRRAGLIAAAMLASSFMFFSFSALCMSDMLLVMFDVLTLTCLYAGLQSEERRGLFWFLASVSLGLAFLTKGPVGIVLPVLSTVTFMTVTGQLKKLRPKFVLVGVVTALLIASPWFIAAYSANGWSALVYFFVHENVQRFAGTAYDAHRPIWYTVVSLFTGFAPWSIFLPFAAIEFFRKGRELVPGVYRNKQLFLWTWVLVIVGFFSISKGKCDYYTLPAFPAAAMLCANYFDRWKTTKWSPVSIALYLLSGALLISSVGIAFVSQKIIGGEWGDWLAAPVILAISGLIAILATKQERPGIALSASYLAICLGGSMLCAQLLPAVLKSVPVQKYALIINAQNDAVPVTVDKSLYTWADEISFQTSRRVSIAGDTESLLKHLDQDGKQMIVLDQTAFDSLPAGERAKMTILSRDYAITKPLTPGLVMQTGGKMLSSIPVLLMANYK